MIGISISAVTRMRLQHGIKFGIAGVLALYCALWLRLDSPRWALSTVIVLMLAQYVGAMVQKALFRLIGTTMGAFLGVLLVGNLLGNGPAFLTLVFICVTIFSYFANGKRAPYAFTLFSYTLLIVVSNNLFTPDAAWEVGLSRALSVIVGIFVTLIVNTVLWPHHARVEFRQLVGQMLGRVAEAMREAEKYFQGDTSNPIQMKEIGARHLKDIQLLHKLLVFGARESAGFALRTPSYEIIVNSLNRLHSVLVAQARYPNSLFAQGLHKSLGNLIVAIEKECTILRQSLVDGRPPEAGLLDAACAAFRHQLDILRTENLSVGDDLPDLSKLATGFLDASNELRTIREELVRLFGNPPYQPPFTIPPLPWFKLNRDHAIIALKAGLVTVFTLIFCNWLHPPGFDMIPACSYLFIMLPRNYFQGDKGQKSIHYTVWAGLITVPILVVFTFLAPWIANYPYANVFLFTSFFLLGIAYFEHVGIYSQLYYAWTLAIAGGLEICRDWPIGPGKFQDWYFGLVLSLLFCALVQRLFWPLLPQNEFFKSCQRYFSGCLKALDHPFAKPASPYSPPLDIFQLAWETERWVPFLPLRACHPAERNRLRELVGEMRSAGYQLTVLKGASRHPETLAFLAEILPLLHPLKENLCRDLRDCYEVFTNREPLPLPSSPYPSPAENFRSFYKTLHEKALLKTKSTRIVMETLGALCHLETAACAIWKCRQLVSNLQLKNYATDVAL